MAALKSIILLVSIPAVLSLELGDICTVGSTKCSIPNSQCKDGKCACNLGYSPVQGKCKETLETTCEKNENCDGILNAECSKDKKCACKKYYHKLDDKCVGGLHATCEKYNDCIVGHTVCNEKQKKCLCGSDFVLISTQDECYPKLPYGNKCSYNEQCSATLENTLCEKKTETTKVCACKDTHFYNKEGQCQLKRWLNEKCIADNECFTENTLCKNELCSCNLGYAQVDKKCVKALGTDCEKNQNCGIDNSECQNKKCNCKKTYFELKGGCAAGLNHECQKNEECKSPNAECSTNKCQCKDKYVTNPDKDECLLKLKYDDKCVHNVQCSSVLEHLICKNIEKESKCQCEDKFPYNKKDEKCGSATIQSVFFLVVITLLPSKFL